MDTLFETMHNGYQLYKINVYIHGDMFKLKSCRPVKYATKHFFHEQGGRGGEGRGGGGEGKGGEGSAGEGGREGGEEGRGGMNVIHILMGQWYVIITSDVTWTE